MIPSNSKYILAPHPQSPQKRNEEVMSMNYVAGRRKLKIEESSDAYWLTRTCGSRVTATYGFPSNRKIEAVDLYDILKDRIRKAHKKEMRKP